MNRRVPILWLLAACSQSPNPASPATTPSDVTIEVYSHTDLPRQESTRGLSATAFDPRSRTLHALQDKSPAIVPLVANESYTQFELGQPIVLKERPPAAWDGEGVVLAPGGFIAVTEESSPTVERFSTTGVYSGPASLPANYGASRRNKGIESLSMSPSGKFLFAANEQALVPDGAGSDKDSGSIVRIARLSADTLKGTQHAYRTDPGGGGMGVSEVAAVDDYTVLVLERGFLRDYGSTVRIFRASLAGAADVSAIESLGSDAPVVRKQLLVDIGTLPSQGFSHPSKQPNPILDNYEALSLGPVLPDGRRLLFVTSDDNGRDTQVARVLVLAVRGI